MSSPDISLLCTGDLHLGRRPTRVPQELDSPNVSPRSIWHAIVEQAIQQDVDGVLISGDVIDRENQYFEAFGAFKGGAERLDEADIPTIVVSGNHDYNSLPQLVSGLDLDNLTLIGTDGSWERHTISEDDQPILHVDGWSFPQEHVLKSPLSQYSMADSDVPVIGLLHADITSADSDYAPVEQHDLEAEPVEAWLLGHIHAPSIHVESSPTVFYPGSPQALDPGEPGPHGPWLLSINGSETGLEQLPLASVRYDQIEVAVDQAESTKEIPPLINTHIEEHVVNNVDTTHLELLVARVKLVGRTPAHREIALERETIEDQLQFKIGSLPVHIDSVEVDTEPAVDLEERAKESSPVGYLAEMLLTLEHGDPDGEYEELISDASESIREAKAGGAYSPLRREGQINTVDEDDAIELVQRQGRLLLHELLTQTEGRV
ncbi:metallophosphoesterase family protein [Haloferax sp. DFSO52]|uniref:metallophosphoesterase family protein n=1 Tax=Haloferax sp. DFSO52 TaxID=3388505 RepID=UPI003A862521